MRESEFSGTLWMGERGDRVCVCVCMRESECVRERVSKYERESESEFLIEQVRAG